MRPKWPKLDSLVHNSCPLYTFSSLLYSFLLKNNLFKNIVVFMKVKLFKKGTANAQLNLHIYTQSLQG